MEEPDDLRKQQLGDDHLWWGPDYLTIRDFSVVDGAEFTQQDVEGANKVALLGKTVVDNLFGDAEPVGQVIRIKNVPFTVVGVLTPKGQSSQGQDQDDVILLPISTAKRKVIGINSANADAVNTLMIQAKSGAQIPLAEEEAKALLRQRHHLQAAEADDFTIRNLQELFAAQEAYSGMIADARGRGFGLAGRGRDRHYEHHADLCPGANAGNRIAPGHRRKDA